MVATCAAIYALVLQIVLTSALAASLPVGLADGGLWRICVGAPAVDGAADSAPLPKYHCPLCFCRIDAASFAPPPASLLIDRFAIELRFEIALESGRRAGGPPESCQPRGPPIAA
ncbi:hypothetical protein [Methylocella sp.]|uniref:hypothetical protein n=1 Tax=Methylocella sp. TaxID=1978226 RepID=UPI00378426F1